MRPTSIFVGGLKEGTKKEDLEAAFNKFPSMSQVWVARNPPGFAFVEFYEEVHAKAAVRDMDGTFINENKIKVTLTRDDSNLKKRGGGGRGGHGGRGGGSYGGGGHRGGRGGYGYGGGGGRGQSYGGGASGHSGYSGQRGSHW